MEVSSLQDLSLHAADADTSKAVAGRLSVGTGAAAVVSCSSSGDPAGLRRSLAEHGMGMGAATKVKLLESLEGSSLMAGIGAKANAKATQPS